MKNFSAKNAEFETVTINNEAAITSADIGTAPNKIPLNKDLGSLAYQDAVNLDDVSADMIELRAIAAEISDSAVDVFVYDTSRDSDGGAWRKRTQHTSWYNEELNTATRGARREFPAVALIVTEANRVAIYDGDDPDLGMWMVLESGGTFGSGDAQLIGNSTVDQVASIMFNGALVTCNSNSYHSLLVVNFLSETSQAFRQSGNYIIPHNIAERHVGDLGVPTFSGNAIVHSTINDVAMTVLPNAPIDNKTGLPVPTIAVATDGGVSVIKDDGTVVDITVSNTTYTYSRSVTWSSVNDLIVVLGNELGTHDYIYTFDKFNSSDNQITIDSKDGTTQNARSFFRRVYNSMFDGFTVQGSSTDRKFWLESTEQNKFAVRSVSGLTIIDENATNSSKSLYNYITSKYNTGWMPGDIKLAALSDSVVENVGVNSDELVADGDFLTDTSVENFATTYPNWGTWDGTCSVAGNKLSAIVSGSSVAAAATTNFPTAIGQRYVVSFDYGYDGGASHLAFWIDDTNAAGQADIYNSGDILSTDSVRSRSVSFTATSSTTYLIFLAYGAASSGVSGEFSNISVRATTELITNGDFSNETTGWTGLSGGVLSIDNERLKIEETTNAVDAYAVNSSVISTVVGQKYLITWQFIKGTNAGFSVRFGNSGDQTYDYKSNIVGEYTADGYYSFEFTATATELNLSFIVNEMSTYGFVDNISVRPAEEDRSVNDNGLQIFGEINKTPVASGADLVAYSGFSANNYLVRPYNADLDFGTGDFSIGFWFNFSAGVEDQKWDDLFSLGDLGYKGVAGATSFILAQLNTVSNYLELYIGGTNDKITRIAGLSRNIWHHVVLNRKDGVATAFINGSQYFSKNNNISISGAGLDQYNLKIGYTGDNYGNIGVGFPANYSKIALFRISKTAPTAEQIAKIYRDEKPLFQEGAQATLYGSSDAVTALAYDDSEQLLHVGTASGRSDFRGLARVNNTTTAISNSISAAEGTIIQN